ncbi:hypothetical protein NLU13_9634 [Sarocladium strictum]|uniref:Long chronological lifespan protein 2 n=1 Tax=Sarocladium strictum TaxID=5046 RepID=A0AA39GAG7_SARSR|nr:hypothetical protein NLU13_9634 [Sarocladium strictum]
MRLLLSLLLALMPFASAHFGFFEQMFGGQEGHGHGHQQQQNNPSDANNYRTLFDQSTCDKYLCPDTLACVHFPHHCPCAWDSHEEKFELGDGLRVCVSKGGYKAGEAARKVELARKGLL